MNLHQPTLLNFLTYEPPDEHQDIQSDVNSFRCHKEAVTYECSRRREPGDCELCWSLRRVSFTPTASSIRHLDSDVFIGLRDGERKLGKKK